MANLRIEVQPDNKPEVTRLAQRGLSAKVHTWRTAIHVHLNGDGSGYVWAQRDGEKLFDTVSFSAEKVKKQ